MLFNTKSSIARDNQLLNKTKNISNVISINANVVAGRGTAQKIASACAVVDAKLGYLKDKYEIVNDKDALFQFMKKAQKNGILSLDTETSGLNPLFDKLAGLCLYTPGSKAIYVPLNHISYITNQRIQNQLTNEEAKQIFSEVRIDKIIFHNAKFDMRFMKNQLGIELKPYWDTMLAAKLLNENESSHGLKYLYKKYVNPDSPEYKFDSLFDGIQFNLVPVKSGYIYAARDAEMTYELYQYQSKYLTERNLPKLYKLFTEIELPLIRGVAAMEDAGIELDFTLAKELQDKYEQQAREVENKFLDALNKYDKQIKEYRQGFKTGKDCKLGNPINISSPSQISVLLYDILKLKSPDKRKPRGTGEEILTVLVSQMPELELLLKYRELKKLLSTYITKMPEVAGKDGKIHCSFNQMGTVTGRFSSSEPNMQNIPSHNKDIRKMFKASEGNVLISCDYSQQEPRILAHLSQDEKLIQSYKDGKDIYAQIASICFHKNYEDCKEFYPDGTVNKEGKKLRSIMKAIVLGIMYGKEPDSIAKDLKITKKDANETYNSFFRLFPKVEDFMIDTQNMAREFGYVETMGGRKRRLPDMQLEPYEMQVIANKSVNYDPLDFSADAVNKEPEIDTEIKEELERKLKRAKWHQEKMQVFEYAQNEYGIKIIDNTMKISDATRQCVNSVIQGSAADMVKRAMLKISNDKELKDLGYKLLLSVHDELIGEVSQKNRKKAAKRVSEIMIEVSQLCLPIKCDVEITKCWYGEPIND